MGNYLGKQSRSLRRHERRPSYTHSAAPVLGLRAVTPGVAANIGPSVDVSPTTNYVAPAGRVPGLHEGRFHHRQPVHRALVLGVGSNIAVLLGCRSRLGSVNVLTYLLTYDVLSVSVIG